MNRENKLPDDLSYVFTVKLSVEEMRSFKGGPGNLLVECDMGEDRKVVEPMIDPFPDNQETREMLRHKFEYLSRYLQPILVSAVVELYNESTLATLIDEEQLKDLTDTDKLLHSWRKGIPRDARSRLKLPKRKRGRKPKLDAKTRTNIDKIYDEQRDKFQEAKRRFRLYEKAFQSRRRGEEWLDGWRRIAETVLGDVSCKIVDKIALSKRTPSELSYEYLAGLYHSGASYLETLVSEARNQRKVFGKTQNSEKNKGLAR